MGITNPTYEFKYISYFYLWRREVEDKYPVTVQMQEQLDKTYKYHSPIYDQPERYEMLRKEGQRLALKIVKNSPPSREQSLALTHLEECIFYVNAAIARNEI